MIKSPLRSTGGSTRMVAQRECYGSFVALRPRLSRGFALSSGNLFVLHGRRRPHQGGSHVAKRTPLTVPALAHQRYVSVFRLPARRPRAAWALYVERPRLRHAQSRTRYRSNRPVAKRRNGCRERRAQIWNRDRSRATPAPRVRLQNPGSARPEEGKAGAAGGQQVPDATRIGTAVARFARPPRCS